MADALADLSVPERLRLTRLRTRMSLRDAATAARDLLPSWVPMSREIVRRLEGGLIQPDDVNPLQVLALAKVYGVDPAGLFYDGTQSLERLSELVESWNQCFAVSAGLAIPA